MKSRKAQMQTDQLKNLVLGIGGAAIVLAVVMIVLSSLQTTADDPTKYCGDGYTANTSQSVDSTNYCRNTSVGGGNVGITRTAAYTATGSIVTQLAQVPTWLGIIIVVALAMVVLAFFYFKGR